MKLTRVKLSQPVTINGSILWELSELANGPLELDEERRLIWVGGKAAGKPIPLEFAPDIDRADPREVCPECREKFVDLRALGAHRRHKHGVKGETHQ